MAIAESESLFLSGAYPEELFYSLIEKIFAKHGKKVAVLIDEYDAPIISQIAKPELAEEIHETLKTFYSCLKDKETERGFTFITGVTKFAQTSIFSGLNNLDDLTLKLDCANICGFTLEEFDALFSERMEETLAVVKAKGLLGPGAQVADLRQNILDWYDGYSWDGKSRVLNPWSILKFFEIQSFNDYWAQTAGAPSFLINLVKTGKIGFTTFNVEEPTTDALNIIQLGDELDPVPLLFQAGYLTVARVDESKTPRQFFLDIPNFEVRMGLIPLLMSIKPAKEPLAAKENCVNMFRALVKLDADGFQKFFGNFLGALPHNIHEFGKVHEAYYHSVFFAAALMAGEKVDHHDASVADGRLDAHFKALDGTHFVFEIKHLALTAKQRQNFDEAELKKLLIKMKGAANKAMRQIETKNYAKPFRGLGQAIHKVALVVGNRSEVLAVFKRDEGA
jgi:hypothetical protein